MMGVVAVLLWGPADSKPRSEAAADVDHSSAPANPAAEAPRQPRAPALPRTQKLPSPLDLRPSLSSPPVVAAPAKQQADPTNDNINLATKQLNAAFREKAGDRIAAENSLKQIAELRARLPATPGTDAAGSAVRN